jgi:hypothetical protein
MHFKSIKYSIICGVLGFAAVGCGQDDTPEDTQSTTTTTDTSTTDTSVTATTSTTIDTAELYGTAPTQPLPAPEFLAYSHEGEPRTREDLMGHPTVLWFFPFADSPG